MSLLFDNHDNPRFVSKVDPRPEHRVAVAKLLATIQFTLRGTPFLYQGQELGMVNQGFTELTQLRDVESHNLAAELTASGVAPAEIFARVLAGTRDHTRVPMAWDAAGGFTTGKPWIAGDGGHVEVNAAAQEGDPASVLEWHRALIAARVALPPGGR
jgi:oligo-1,6-glucosidase